MADQQNSSKSIMYATIAVAILLMVVIVPFGGVGTTSTTADNDDADVRIQPVARFDLQLGGAADAAASSGPKDGPTVYASVCGACHDTGAAGAPKKGDKAAWAARLGAGNDALLAAVINGKGAMPPKGGAANLSDEEVKGAMDYLIAQSK